MLIAALALLCPGSASADTPSPRPQVVGGSPASITDFPYQVWVTRQAEDLLCGGSILDSTHVVTAAHCVLAENTLYPEIASPASYKVGYGSAGLSTVTFTGVSRIVVDRRYQRQLESDAYDLAILQLATPIVQSASAAPIVPATPSEVAAAFASGAPGTVTGWGVTNPSDPGSISAALRVADLPLISDGACGPLYDPYLVGPYQAPAMLCAGTEGKGTCPGDSGGPLAIDVDPGPGVNRHLAGVTSLGLADSGRVCNAGGSPSVYTEVSEPTTRSLLVSPPAIDPPALPIGNAVITGTLAVGERVGCEPPPSAGGQPVQFLFYLTSGSSLELFAQSGSNVTTLPPATQGQSVLCDARYENAAGFAYSDTSLAGLAGPVAPPLPKPPPPPPPPADTTAPGVSRLSMTRRTFRVGQTNTARSARRRPSPRGTEFRFRLSEAATVSIKIERVLPGRKVGKKCRPESRRLRKRKRCTRYVRKATLTRRNRKAGANKVRFSGRIGRSPLRAGHYRATVTAVDAAGNRSKGRRTSFTLVRR